MAVFTWLPDTDATNSVKTNVIATKFGDGYESRTPNGLNSVAMNWSLTFSVLRAEGLAILDFLKLRNGSEAFTWTNPLNQTGLYVCREWTSMSNRGYLTITATFEQVFSPV